MLSPKVGFSPYIDTFEMFFFSISLSMNNELLSKSMVIPNRVRDRVGRECLSSFMGSPDSVHNSDNLSKYLKYHATVDPLKHYRLIKIILISLFDAKLKSVSSVHMQIPKSSSKRSLVPVSLSDAAG